MAGAPAPIRRLRRTTRQQRQRQQFRERVFFCGTCVSILVALTLLVCAALPAEKEVVAFVESEKLGLKTKSKNSHRTHYTSSDLESTNTKIVRKVTVTNHTNVVQEHKLESGQVRIRVHANVKQVTVNSGGSSTSICGSYSDSSKGQCATKASTGCNAKCVDSSGVSDSASTISVTSSPSCQPRVQVTCRSANSHCVRVSTSCETKSSQQSPDTGRLQETDANREDATNVDARTEKSMLRNMSDNVRMIVSSSLSGIYRLLMAAVPSQNSFLDESSETSFWSVFNAKARSSRQVFIGGSGKPCRALFVFGGILLLALGISNVKRVYSSNFLKYTQVSITLCPKRLHKHILSAIAAILSASSRVAHVFGDEITECIPDIRPLYVEEHSDRSLAEHEAERSRSPKETPKRCNKGPSFDESEPDSAAGSHTPYLQETASDVFEGLETTVTESTSFGDDSLHGYPPSLCGESLSVTSTVSHESATLSIASLGGRELVPEEKIASSVLLPVSPPRPVREKGVLGSMEEPFDLKIISRKSSGAIGEGRKTEKSDQRKHSIFSVDSALEHDVISLESNTECATLTLTEFKEKHISRKDPLESSHRKTSLLSEQAPSWVPAKYQNRPMQQFNFRGNHTQLPVPTALEREEAFQQLRLWQSQQVAKLIARKKGLYGAGYNSSVGRTFPQRPFGAARFRAPSVDSSNAESSEATFDTRMDLNDENEENLGCDLLLSSLLDDEDDDVVGKKLDTSESKIESEADAFNMDTEKSISAETRLRPSSPGGSSLISNASNEGDQRCVGEVGGTLICVLSNGLSHSQSYGGLWSNAKLPFLGNGDSLVFEGLQELNGKGTATAASWGTNDSSCCQDRAVW